MLTYDDALNLNYYKKTTFTGWMGGMRFLIKRETLEDADAIFHVWIWPGPYIFDMTDDSLKRENTFPFSEDGKKQAVDWINTEYEANIKYWPRRKTDEVKS